jgi:hypothetical protein
MNIQISPDYLAQQAFHWSRGCCTAVSRYASHIDLIPTVDEYLSPLDEHLITSLFFELTRGVDTTAPNARRIIRDRVDDLI